MRWLWPSRGSYLGVLHGDCSAPQTQPHNPPMQMKGSLKVLFLSKTTDSLTLRCAPLTTASLCPKTDDALEKAPRDPTLWLACNVGDLGLIPGLGRSPGEGNGYPLQCSGLENSMDCIVRGVAESDMPEGFSLSGPQSRPPGGTRGKAFCAGTS